MLINELIKEKYKIILVNCGKCGNIISQTIDKKEIEQDEISCPICGYTAEQSNFPDLFY